MGAALKRLGFRGCGKTLVEIEERRNLLIQEVTAR
jgi:hypothetical protein